MAREFTLNLPGAPYANLLRRMPEWRLQDELASMRTLAAQLRVSTDWTKTRRAAMAREYKALEAVILAEMSRRGVAVAA
jgi:hypothetical protein